jgi:hypothetical protein
MESIRSPKRRFELQLHGTKSKKASITDTALTASKRTVFFDHKLYPSMERLKTYSAVTQL